MFGDDSAGAVQLAEEPVEVAQAVLTSGVLQGLVLGKHVDESLADLITMAPKRFDSALA